MHVSGALHASGAEVCSHIGPTELSSFGEASDLRAAEEPIERVRASAGTEVALWDASELVLAEAAVSRRSIQLRAERRRRERQGRERG